MKIKTFEGIEDMPMARYQDFNIAILIDSGIGTDTEAFDKHIVLALKYIEKGEKKKAQQTVLNFRQSIAMAIERVSPETTAFAAWVKEVDGQDVSEKTAEQVVKMLNKKRFTLGFVRRKIEALKKKLK